MINNDLLTKSMKGVNEKKDAEGAATKGLLDINYQKAATDAINKVKQDLATKDIGQKLKQEIEKQQKKETLSAVRLEPETGDSLIIKSNCNSLKMKTGKIFGITKIGARIMSIINVGATR